MNYIRQGVIHCLILMQPTRTLPATLYLQTKTYSFCLTWTELSILQIQAIKKNQPNKCYRGKLTSQQLQKGTSIKSLFDFLQQSTLSSSITKTDYLSLIITIIDQTDSGKGYSCRILFQHQIKSIKVEPFPVSETYFLTKKIQALQQQKNSDRILIAQFGNELTKKIQEKDYDIKKALTEQIQDMFSAVTNRIQKQFRDRSKISNHPSSEAQIEIDSIPNVHKIQKKIRKKIKKQLKEKKKAKKHRERQKKKKRKARRKEKRRIKALLEAQQNGMMPIDLNALTDPLQLNDGLLQKNNMAQNGQTNDNLLDVDVMPLNGEIIQNNVNKKKKKKEKHKHRQIHENPTIHTQPQQTSLVGMSKLRTRGGVDFPRTDNPIQIIQQDQEQVKTKKQKRSKEKKNKSKQKKNKNNEVQQIEQQGQKEYYKRLEQIRKAGNIDEVRVTKVNRNKPILALPKQPLTEVDQFNPKYNGQPKYKPFVRLNEYQAIRPGQIFAQKFDTVSAECKKIPTNFRQQIPSFKNFDVNGCVVRKKQGLNYQQMVFDYLLPQTGKHVLTMRLIQTKRMYIWFGIIDLRQKDRQQSFNKKNCITFSFRTGHIATSNKWSKGKIGRMQVGLSIRMEVDMDKNSIIWYISDGRNNIAPIPKLMRKLMLVPYFEMMDVGDEICFQQ